MRMGLHFGQAIFLLIAAGIAGALNALAGGGSFISFPALLFIRVPAVAANATNTVALWPGLAASTIAYLRRLNAPPRVLVPLLVTSVAGGWAGALLLLRTPQHTFLRLVPWLLLGGTLLFAFGNSIRSIAGKTAVIDDLRDTSWHAILVSSIAELLVSDLRRILWRRNRIRDAGHARDAGDARHSCHGRDQNAAGRRH